MDAENTPEPPAPEAVAKPAVATKSVGPAHRPFRGLLERDLHGPEMRAAAACAILMAILLPLVYYGAAARDPAAALLDAASMDRVQHRCGGCDPLWPYYVTEPPLSSDCTNGTLDDSAEKTLAAHLHVIMEENLMLQCLCAHQLLWCNASRVARQLHVGEACDAVRGEPVEAPLCVLRDALKPLLTFGQFRLSLAGQQSKSTVRERATVCPNKDRIVQRYDEVLLSAELLEPGRPRLTNLLLSGPAAYCMQCAQDELRNRWTPC